MSRTLILLRKLRQQTLGVPSVAVRRSSAGRPAPLVHGRCVRSPVRVSESCWIWPSKSAPRDLMVSAREQWIHGGCRLKREVPALSRAAPGPMMDRTRNDQAINLDNAPLTFDFGKAISCRSGPATLPESDVCKWHNQQTRNCSRRTIALPNGEIRCYRNVQA
jgi:hypothetical protein